MKPIKYIALFLIGATALFSCSDDDLNPGMPVMDSDWNANATALFGDSLRFSVKVSDESDIPLSTLKAQLYYDEEMVAETVIRTKTEDEYTGKIYIPYYANIPNGTATLKYILQNINFTVTEKECELPLSRPDFPYLTLVTENGEYRMERTGLYRYSVEADFPQKVKAYIKSPKMGENGNEIRFGWSEGAVTQGTDSPITFSNSNAGKYEITFNTLDYSASPFIKLLLNGTEMEALDEDNYALTLNLRKGQEIEVSGIPNYEEWWIDPDFFTQSENGKLNFEAIDGQYRITANFKHQYFIVEAMQNGEPATLQNDGSGAVWIIGENIGKPSVGANAVGWTTEKGLCMAPVEKGKYRITVVGGRQITAATINFKFFHQKGWGGEFGSEALTTDSDIVFIGDGENGRDNGNLGIREGKAFDLNGIYVFTLDVTAGPAHAVLTVEKTGEQAAEEKNIYFDGSKMEAEDMDHYSIVKNLTQGQNIEVRGIGDAAAWYINPDYFKTEENGTLTFLPLDGSYKVTANLAQKYLNAVRMNGDAEATLGDDGHGAVWMMAWGVGSPSLDQQFGWDPGKAYCLPEIAPRVYRFTGTAGPEQGSQPGQRLRFDYLSFKFFFQNGWGGELAGDNSLTLTAGSEAFIQDKGNFELADGVQLEEGAVYIVTVDLSAGNSNGTLSFEKQ